MYAKPGPCPRQAPSSDELFPATLEPPRLCSEISLVEKSGRTGRKEYLCYRLLLQNPMPGTKQLPIDIWWKQSSRIPVTATTGGENTRIKDWMLARHQGPCSTCVSGRTESQRIHLILFIFRKGIRPGLLCGAVLGAE